MYRIGSDNKWFVVATGRLDLLSFASLQHGIDWKVEIKLN
jgi:hypothetical protein